MIKLVTLKASDNQITDLEGIRNCTILERLELMNNQLTELSVLEGRLVDLTSLLISGNSVADLSPISASEKLEYLLARGNGIESLEPLSSLNNLKCLDVDDNALTSLAGLENKEQLLTLQAGNNQITDISALESSADLLYLDLRSNQLTDISVLNWLNRTDGLYLCLEHNQIQDFSPLPVEGAGMYELLSFYDNPVTVYPDFQALETKEENILWQA